MRRYLLVLIFSVAAHGADRPLVFAGDQDYAPLIFLDNGEPKGIFVDIIRAMQFPGRAVEIRLMDWQKAQQETLAGMADVTIGMSITPERRQDFDFTETVMMYEYAIFVPRQDLTTHSFRDLRGRRVGVTSGGLPRKVLEADAAIRLTFIPNYADGFEMLRSGGLDAVVADSWVALYTLHQKRIADIVPARGDTTLQRPGAFSVKKGNKEILKALNQRLETLKSSGKLAEIIERWSPQEMVYLTRERVRTLTIVTLAVALGFILIVLSLWIVSLKRGMNKLRAAKQTISDNQVFFEKLTRFVPGMIYQFKMDTAGNFSMPFVSDSIRMITELTSDEIMADYSRLASRIHPDDIQKFIASIHTSAAEMKQWRFEYRSILPVQGLRWRYGEAQPERMANGDIIWHGYISDVTDRKLSEIQIAELTAKIIDLRETERAEIAAELHDSVGQNLVLLKLRLQSKIETLPPEFRARFSDLLEPTDRALSTTREISRRLSPMHLKTLGLAAAVEDLCDQVRKSRNFRISLDIEKFAVRIPAEQHIQVYRIVQEALTNILKHSNAQEIRILGRHEEQKLTLCIEDNGTQEISAHAASPGIGRQIMNERARLIGGTVTFEATARGARLTLTLPA